MKLVIGWSADEGLPSLHLDVICPPVPVLTSAAANLHHGLFGHPIVRPMLNTIRDMMAVSQYPFLTHEVDGAQGNTKLHHFAASNEFPPQTLTTRVQCSNHGEHLVTGSVIGLFNSSLSLLNNLYAASKFLAVDGHFLRMLQVVADIVREQMVIMEGCPPVECTEYSAIVIDWVRRNWEIQKQEEDMGGSGEVKEHKRGKTLLEEELQEFRAVLNGPWWIRGDLEEMS